MLEAHSVAHEVEAAIGKWAVDFRVGSLVIEADGDYWHSTDRAIEADARKTRELEAMGFTVWRIPESEIMAPAFPGVLARRLSGFAAIDRDNGASTIGTAVAVGVAS